MLRAEQVAIAPAAGNTAGGLRAQITERLFLGEKIRYELKVPGTELRLTAISGGDHLRLSLGDEVIVTADPRHVRVLPRAAAPRVGA
jgi:hypothetical protein